MLAGLGTDVFRSFVLNFQENDLISTVPMSIVILTMSIATNNTSWIISNLLLHGVEQTLKYKRRHREVLCAALYSSKFTSVQFFSSLVTKFCCAYSGSLHLQLLKNLVSI